MENYFENKFFEKILWFLEDDQSSIDSGCFSDIAVPDQRSVSGFSGSFSGRVNTEPIYKSHYMNSFLRTTWSAVSAGLVSSSKETLPERTVVERHKNSPGKSKLLTQPPIKCRFCFKNGAPQSIYSTHYLKDAEGTITCPCLRNYVCDLCGATGSFSHTRKYCPQYPEFFFKNELRRFLGL